MALDDVVRDLLIEVAKYLDQRPSDGRGGRELVHRHDIVGIGNSLFLPAVASDSTGAASDAPPRR